MDKVIDQILYDDLYAMAESKYECYQFNPPKGTAYPYVQFGNTINVPRATKSYLIAEINIGLDVWGDSDDRKTVSDIAYDLFNECGKLTRLTSGHIIKLMPRESSVEVRIDQSTNEDLWRGMVNLKFNVY
jgi:hypothetical protein